MTTSRRPRRETTSRLNCKKLSAARRRSGPGAGMKGNTAAGMTTIAPITTAAMNKLAADCNDHAGSTDECDVDPLAERVFLLVRGDIGKPATEGGTGEWC